ncbi:MAG TPA: hypothetical protein VJ801_16240 [Polyangia bacterium]|jgi:hypothetical protein|nr:hypothetical protein [Polyangia bacterium]
MKYFFASAPILFAALLFGAPARADVVAPWYAACQGKQAGTACFYNDVNADQGVGTCQNGVCVVSAATATNTNTTTNTTTATNTQDGAPPSEDDGACSMGKQATAKRAAPWLLAGTSSLLFLFGRRRRRS